MRKHLFCPQPKYGKNKFATVGGHNVHYIEAGSGKPLLLIPGLLSTCRTWNRVIPFLFKEYMVIAIDYLGVGYSDKPLSGFSYTVQEQTDLVAKLIDKLRIRGADVMGVSYGGIIALNLTARYSNLARRIICIEGGAKTKPTKVPWSPMIGILGRPVIGDGLIGIIRSGLLTRVLTKLIIGEAWRSMSIKDRREIVAIVAEESKTASRVPWYQLSQTLETSKEFPEEAKTIKNPVLYLYGENSIFRETAEANAMFLKSHLPNVTTKCIKDGIHDLQLQKPQEVANLVLEFLGGPQRQVQLSFQF